MLTFEPRTSFGNAEGIYVDEVAISSAIDQHGLASPFDANDKIDIGVKVTFNIGKDFEPSMDVWGVGEYTDGVLIDIGTAWPVRDLFSRAGVTLGLNDDGSISPESLSQLVGRKVLRLTYVSGRKEDSGKPKYTTWKSLASVSEGAEAFKKRFLKGFREKGYPKNYNPGILLEDQGPTAAQKSVIDQLEKL